MELIKIEVKDGKQLVSCRELYEFLGLDSGNWKRWYTKNILEDEFFIEKTDWEGFLIERNGNETQDFAITIDMAKHLSMLARTKKGHEARQYFISCEKKLKSQMPQTLTEAVEAWLITLKAKDEAEAKAKALEIKSNHQKDIIIGLVEDIPLADKRQRINQVVRHNTKGVQDITNRWNKLYREFELKAHVNLDARLKNKDIIAVKPKINSKIKLIEHMGKIPELYEIACIIFETDMDEIIKRFRP